ncbi:hypothetical protein ACNFCI_23940, partial [Pseudomonas sp. NY15356]
YRTGTVAITAGQTTVTGTGTNFSANARVGDALLGPDGNWYEVTNIASTTVLSILPAYKGATVTGGTYAITPVQGYTKTLADKFNDIANTWGSTLAGLGSVSTENVVPVTKGGTGGTTQATARNGLGLKAAAVADIVGTVSQSGGVPTGAIVERGSNANGDYVKFADGTLICTTTNRAVSFVNASNLNFTWIYPISFVAAVPAISVNIASSTVTTQRQITTVCGYSRSVAQAVCAALSIAQFVAADASAMFLDVSAIGRWY